MIRNNRKVKIRVDGMTRSDFALWCHLTESFVRSLNRYSRVGAGIAKMEHAETKRTIIPFNQIPLGLVASQLQRLGANVDMIAIMLAEGKLSRLGVWTYKDKGGIRIRIDTKETERWHALLSNPSLDGVRSCGRGAV